MTPQARIEAACARIGAAAVVDGCLAVLAGDRADDVLLAAVGPNAQYVLDGAEGGPGGYWPRTWALRVLLYAWDPRATAAVQKGLADEHWRVREMALKVIARQRLDEALALLPALLSDPVPRVRAAAARAQQRLTSAAGA